MTKRKAPTKKVKLAEVSGNTVSLEGIVEKVLRNNTTATSQKAPKQSAEVIKQESNTKVAKKPTKANSTATGASIAKPRGRSKKVAITEGNFNPTDENLNKLVESSKASYQKYKETGKISGYTRVTEDRVIVCPEPKPSLYDRFVGWLVRITYNFRGH